MIAKRTRRRKDPCQWPIDSIHPNIHRTRPTCMNWIIPTRHTCAARSPARSVLFSPPQARPSDWAISGSSLTSSARMADRPSSWFTWFASCWLASRFCSPNSSSGAPPRPARSRPTVAWRPANRGSSTARWASSAAGSSWRFTVRWPDGFWPTASRWRWACSRSTA